MGGGGDAGQPTLLNGEALISCLRSSPGMPWNSPPPSALPHACSSLPPVGKNAKHHTLKPATGRVPSRVPSSQHPQDRAAPHPSTGVGGRVCPQRRSAPKPQSAELWKAGHTIQPMLPPPPPPRCITTTSAETTGKKEDFHAHLFDININLKVKFKYF